jgi:curli biogenesis system outer membrane secretion channel CsgG
MKFRFSLLCASIVLLAGCAGFRPERPTQTTIIEPLQSQIVNSSNYGLKRKVAIGRFTNDTRAATSFLNEGGESSIALSRAANDILSSKLAMSNKFLLIERHEAIDLDTEQLSGVQSLKIPADYLILGSISEFGRNTKGNVGLVGRSKTQTAHAKVNLRIVDTRTGIVIYGEEGSGESSSETGTTFGMGTTGGYDDTLGDKAIDAAISAVINNLINKLSDEDWRSYILSYDNDKFVISGGALQGINIGDEFYVYEKGKMVKNPQTGIDIELPGTQVGKIKIVQLIPGNELTELSFATLISGDILPSDLENLYISDK